MMILCTQLSVISVHVLHSQVSEGGACIVNEERKTLATAYSGESGKNW